MFRYSNRAPLISCWFLAEERPGLVVLMLMMMIAITM